MRARGTGLSRAVTLGSALFALWALAAPARADRDEIVVFVEPVAIEEGLSIDARALTSSLCGALSKETKIEVSCAPDVQQLLDFAGQLALLGKGSDATQKLEQQMQRVRFVVRALVKRQKGGGLLVELRLHDKGAGGTGVLVVAGHEKARFRELVPSGKSAHLLDRIPTLAKRAVERMLVPEGTLPPPPMLEDARAVERSPSP